MKVCDLCRKGPELAPVGQLSIGFQTAGKAGQIVNLDVHEDCGKKLFDALGKTIGDAVGDWIRFLPVEKEK